MQYTPPNVPALSQRWTMAALGIMIISLVLLIHQALPSGSTSTSLPVSSIQAHATRFKHKAIDLKESASNLKNAESPLRDTAAIPNIIHFVHLLEAGSDVEFDFPFRQFVAIYSAHYHMKPRKIYIWTNVEEQSINDVVRKSKSPYTQAVSRLSTVEFRYHPSPNQTSKGLAIELLPHQADFVRTDVLRKHGGIYLDDDAYILRNLHDLRRIGFENIVGRQAGGGICNAVIMATRENKMVSAFDELQDKVFDGQWTRHSVNLLTTLALEFSEIEHEVLILGQDTFFPLSWMEDGLRDIYERHEDVGKPASKNGDAHDLRNYINFFEDGQQDTWQRDWRSSYILHGWTSAIPKDGEVREALFGDYGDITLAYVLEQSSNFARAVFPAVKHALDHGFLDHLRTEESESQEPAISEG